MRKAWGSLYDIVDKVEEGMTNYMNERQDAQGNKMAELAVRIMMRRSE